jgi:transcriptional regulator with XRE-family HTH domain
MKLLRLATGLSATDFARENGMGRAMWHNIEVGFSRIGIDAAMSLCDKYQITLDWIYRGHDARLPRSLTKRLQEVAEAEPEGDA